MFKKPVSERRAARGGGDIMRFVRVIRDGTESRVETTSGGSERHSSVRDSDEKPQLQQDLNIYTDGSCVHNGGKRAFGGIGVFFGIGDPRNISECVRFGADVHGAVTNQATEILACLRAMETAVDKNDANNNIVIHTDSEYVVKSMNVWAYAWSKNGWKNKKGAPVANVANMRRLFDLKRKLRARFVHVPAHGEEPAIKRSRAWTEWFGNAQADELARRGAARCSHPPSTSAVSFRVHGGKE